MLDVAQIRTKTFRGMPFRFAEVRGTPADHASWWSFDDEQELRDRYWNPQANETVLDIGAAFGSYALPALARGARVVCFSPADFDTELLAKNLSLNPEFEARCLVVRDGLHSRDGLFDPDHCRFVDDATFSGVTVSEGDQWLRVRSLDSFLAETPAIDRVDWMKIDVEGAELDVLHGAEQCLRSYRPNLLVENHEFHRRGISEAVRDYVVGLGLGYRCDGPFPHCAVSHSFFSAR